MVDNLSWKYIIAWGFINNLFNYKMTENKDSFYMSFKEYHQHDVWGRFLEWLEKLIKRKEKKNEQKNRNKK